MHENSKKHCKLVPGTKAKKAKNNDSFSGISNTRSCSKTSNNGLIECRQVISTDVAKISDRPIDENYFQNQPERSILSVNELKKSKGLEDLTEAEAIQMINTLHELSNLLYQSFITNNDYFKN